MRNSSTNPIGMVMRSKNGLPTAMRSPLMASMISGQIVPTSTINAKAAKTTLLAMNAPSRESGESILPTERSSSPRQPISPTVTTTMTAKKPSSAGPTPPSANACTEAMTPERVRKVPRMVRANVAQMSDRFQTRNMPRRSCTMTE